MQSRPAWANLKEGAPQPTPAATTLTKYSHWSEQWQESWPYAHPAPTLEPGPHLLGTAVKLENTYLAIMSRHVSVSSKWRFFKLSSAWAIEFSSADPRLALVRDVWILLEGGAMARSGHWAGQIIYHGDQRWRHACAERAKPETPRQCTWPREPQLGQQSGHVTPERKCRS